MAYTVDVDLNRGEIHALMVNRARLIGNKVQRVAQRRAPKATGALAGSIFTIVGSAPGFAFAEIGSLLDYAIWQHEGTGIYGPTGRPITPKRAKVMRFKPQRGIGPTKSGFVYARSVKGIPPTPFLVRALVDVVGFAEGTSLRGRP